ncbi:MAG: hypothetical protein LBI09_01080 [Nitrososphaerota archaeon]|nr:hypothetical protein [Nitrososphaerota archaeon]
MDYNITDPSHVDIYSLTSSKNVVTFIWHCQTASDYPGNGLLPYDTYGYVSMPYIWTHNPSMLKYSTSSGSSQVYLGWVDRAGYTITWPNGTTTNTGPGTTYPTIGSPQYEWKINPTYNYGHVAYLFWHNMCNGDTTNDALNTLSKTVYGSSVNFRSSDLNDWLIVYGNMNLGLP